MEIKIKKRIISLAVLLLTFFVFLLPATAITSGMFIELGKTIYNHGNVHLATTH